MKAATDQPFGVNLRADAGDAAERVDLLISDGVKVASFALAPKPDLIAKLKDHGIVVMPSSARPSTPRRSPAGAPTRSWSRAARAAATPARCRPHCCCRPCSTPVDIPVVAAGGFFDGRGLAAALSYGAAGVGMGTRFLLTQDSPVPDAVKQRYLDAGLDGTVVTTKVDGMPHRMLRTGLVEQVESGPAARGFTAACRTPRVQAMCGMTWR